MTPPRGFYEWNDTANRYVDPRGRFVSRSAVRVALDSALQSASNDARAIANAYRLGKITRAEFTTAMRDAIKSVHLYSSAAAKGGWNHVTDADLLRVGKIVRREYSYLDNALRAKLDGRFVARVGMYMQSARRTYHAVDMDMHKAKGYREERSVLHPADHCAKCVAESQKGWKPLGSLIPIGMRTCLTNCRCKMLYRRRV